MRSRTLTMATRLPWLTFIIGSASTAFIVGCAQVPHQAIHEAEKAMEEAQKAGAELYAFSKFKAAQVSFENARKELFEENKKMPFMRKYNKITETLKSATSAAKSAQAAVEGAKTLIRTETVGMINQTKVLADTVAALLKEAFGKKKNTGPLAATMAATMTAEVDSVRAALKSANASLAADNLLAAKEQATVAQAKITAVAKSAEKLVSPRKAKSAAKKK
jgi:hypothetical protein